MRAKVAMDAGEEEVEKGFSGASSFFCSTLSWKSI
jgi:hypothetical protein